MYTRSFYGCYDCFRCVSSSFSLPSLCVTYLTSSSLNWKQILHSKTSCFQNKGGKFIMILPRLNCVVCESPEFVCWFLRSFVLFVLHCFSSSFVLLLCVSCWWGGWRALKYSIRCIVSSRSMMRWVHVLVV